MQETIIQEHTIKSWNQESWEEITNIEFAHLFDLKANVSGYLTAKLSFYDENDKKHYKYFKKKLQSKSKEKKDG